MEDFEQVKCEFCKKLFSKSSILVHIGKNESCKSHYGNRFNELKRKKNKEKMQRSRKKHGTEKELKRQRELYAQDSKKKEKKRQRFQEKQSKLASEEGWQYRTSNDVSEKNDTKSVEATKEFEDSNDKRACKFCKKKFSLSTILKHLSHNATCKSSYGNNYKKLERKIIKERKQLAKKKNLDNREGIAEKIDDCPDSKIPEEVVEVFDKDLKVSCKFCKRQFLQKSLLRHISRNKLCKASYGEEFNDMKRRKISNRKKQTYRVKQDKETEERIRLFEEKQKRTEITKEKLPEVELNQKGFEDSEESDEVSCEFCKEKFVSSSILIHISMKKSCKSHYGPKFEEMKKEQKRIKMQLYRQRIGSSKEIELYASDPRKKEKKKQYYIKNQKKIKDYQKKKYDEVLEEKKAFWHEENKKWEVRFLADYKKSRDQDVRKKNDWGLKFAKGYVQNGSKIIGGSKKIIKQFETEIEETHETFLKRIEEAFECAKDETDTKIIDKLYEGLDDKYLTNRDLRTVSRTWHDLKLSITLKFIEMAKEMGIKYPGSNTCICSKCQDAIGLKNIRKAQLNGGFSASTNRAFDYMRTQSHLGNTEK